MFVARACAIASAAACIFITGASAQSQRGPEEWVRLGCHDIVRSGGDEAWIRVQTRRGETRAETRFTAIKLEATNSNVQVRGVKPYFARGTYEDYNGSWTVSDGRPTEAFRLPGTAREVRLVNIRFQASIRGQSPQICAYGLAARQQQNWIELGCHTVDFRTRGSGPRTNFDYDKFPVRGDNAFESVRLTVYEADIRVDRFNVNYRGPNRSEEIKLRDDERRIGQGFSSRRHTLKHDGQRISEIELWYATDRGEATKALVCVEGIVAKMRPQDQIGFPEGWKDFGCHIVEPTADSGEIKVGPEKGWFSAIQLRAYENNVRLQNLDVVLGNRQQERIGAPNIDRINKGGPPQTVNINTRNRPHRIDRIELRFRTASRRDGGAFICVAGQVAERPPRRDPVDFPEDGNWKTLGCQSVQRSGEYDDYEVGRDEGQFSRIRFRAQRHDVEVEEIRITYGGTQLDQITATHRRSLVVKRGTTSQSYDLPGDLRVIQRIEIRYSSGFSRPSDEAFFCIEGLQGRSRASGDRIWNREPISDRRRDRDR